MNLLPFNAILLALFLVRFLLGLRFLFLGWGLIQQGRLASKELIAAQGKFSLFLGPLGNSRTFDMFTKWAMFFAGLALAFGFLVRLFSVIAILLMLFFWLSGISKKQGIINEWLIYAAVLIFFIALNAGIPLSYNALLLQFPPVMEYYQSNIWLQWIL